MSCCWNAFCIAGDCDGTTHVDVDGRPWTAQIPTHRVVVDGVEEVRGTLDEVDHFVNYWRARLSGSWVLEHRADDGQWTPVLDQPEWGSVPDTE